MEKNPGQSPQPQDSQTSNKDRSLKKLGLFTIIVSDLMGYTGAGIGIGYLAWTKWGAPWWVLLMTSLAGLGLAFYRLYKISEKEL
jgi:F0F1-type ATP synthase assembly protein I